MTSIKKDQDNINSLRELARPGQVPDQNSLDKAEEIADHFQISKTILKKALFSPSFRNALSLENRQAFAKGATNIRQAMQKYPNQAARFEDSKLMEIFREVEQPNNQQASSSRGTFQPESGLDPETQRRFEALRTATITAPQPKSISQAEREGLIRALSLPVEKFKLLRSYDEVLRSHREALKSNNKEELIKEAEKSIKNGEILKAMIEDCKREQSPYLYGVHQTILQDRKKQENDISFKLIEKAKSI